MKKIAIILIVLVFGVFAFFGFKAASKLLPSNRVPSINLTASEPTPIPLQQNYLFIHVDDLSVKSPRLISVWVVFDYPSTPPQLMTLPVYPSQDSFADDLIGKAFKLDSKKKLSSRFLSQLKKVYEIQVDGYILADDTAINFSNLWLTGTESSPLPLTDETGQPTQGLLFSEETSWLQFCQTVSSGSAGSYFNAINWSQLLPDHFYTDLPFNTITLAMDQIIHAAAPAKCDVLFNE